MITDIGVSVLADNETVPDSGVGGYTESSVNLALDPSGITEKIRQNNDIGSGQRLMLDIHVDTPFTVGSFNQTIEFQLVSLPINASLLTDGAGGATDGKMTSTNAAVATIATDLITVVGHGLPLGAPVWLSDVTTVTGVAVNTLYWVIPEDADNFKLATSLVNAIAGTEITLLTGNGTVDIEWIPTIHGSTGGLPIFDTPVDAGPLSVAGRQFNVPLRGLSGTPSFYSLPTLQAAVPILTDLEQQLGAGPEALMLAAQAQRFYYLRVVPSATITAGAFSCNLVLDSGQEDRFYASGYEVIG